MIDKSEVSIHVGRYYWGNQPPPKCDSCKKNLAMFKIHAKRVGIRLCKECLKWFKEELEGYKI